MDPAKTGTSHFFLRKCSTSIFHYFSGGQMRSVASLCWRKVSLICSSAGDLPLRLNKDCKPWFCNHRLGVSRAGWSNRRVVWKNWDKPARAVWSEMVWSVPHWYFSLMMLNTFIQPSAHMIPDQWFQTFSNIQTNFLLRILYKLNQTSNEIFVVCWPKPYRSMDFSAQGCLF